jgi:hypothetical protein
MNVLLDNTLLPVSPSQALQKFVNVITIPQIQLSVFKESRLFEQYAMGSETI